jgi:hypothetical protein
MPYLKLVHKRIQHRLLCVLVVILGVFIFSSFVSPNITLWSWDHAEDLRFLDKGVDVAYLAGSVVVRGRDMKMYKRSEPLILAQYTKVIPVVRIDNFETISALTEERVNKIEDFVLRLCGVPLVVGCQVDFDVKVSERAAYAKMLKDIRVRLPEAVPLSITALASWCDKGSWLEELPIEYAVPMLYRLGADGQNIRSGYTGQSFLKAAKCAQSVGVSVDEPVPPKKYRRGKDVFIFNPSAWTKKDFETILEEL